MIKLAQQKQTEPLGHRKGQNHRRETMQQLRLWGHGSRESEGAKMQDEHSQTICCPRCNCNGVDRITTDAAVDIYQCGFCQTRFEHSQHNDLDREPMAIFAKTICPYCKESNNRVTHKEGNGIRRHQCNGCGLPFKSRELNQ